jgi:dienelactone hydrolase
MPDLSAAVPFYGAPPAAADVPKIKAAVLAHHGELDTRLAATWPDYDVALTAARIPHEGDIYPKANHGFHNDTTARYDEACRQARLDAHAGLVQQIPASQRRHDVTASVVASKGEG